jgi:hypothetical protein
MPSNGCDLCRIATPPTTSIKNLSRLAIGLSRSNLSTTKNKIAPLEQPDRAINSVACEPLGPQTSEPEIATLRRGLQRKRLNSASQRRWRRKRRREQRILRRATSRRSQVGLGALRANAVAPRWATQTRRRVRKRDCKDFQPMRGADAVLPRGHHICKRRPGGSGSPGISPVIFFRALCRTRRLGLPR